MPTVRLPRRALPLVDSGTPYSAITLSHALRAALLREQVAAQKLAEALDERGKAPLPQVVALAFAEVHPPRVPPVGCADPAAQALGRRGHDDEAHVVRHRTVAPDAAAGLAAPLDDQREVLAVVVVKKERLEGVLSLSVLLLGGPNVTSGRALLVSPRRGRVL